MSTPSTAYLLGAYWYDKDPENQLPRFLRDGVWENGYEDKYLKLVQEIPVGAPVLIKASYFHRGLRQPVLSVRARGVVTANAGNGRNLSVKWETDFKEYLIPQSELAGIGRYRQREGQVKALRGTLLFGQHLARNVVHQERFYTRHQTYDPDHLPHRLLRQALTLLPTLSPHAGLRGRAARALLAWPELPPVRPTPATFARLRYNRKTAPYRPALRIARLLLLRLSPDLHSGPQELVALFFNMNHIWEAYLLRTLRRLAPPDWAVSKPAKVVFWEAKNGQQSRMQPDILLHHATHGRIVLDAKWKRPHGCHAENDLRQLFAYAQHFGATRVRLLYPQAAREAPVEGRFTRPLVVAGGAEPPVIRCGVSYVRVGQPAASPESPAVPNADAAFGYLPCSLETELSAWLPR